MLSSAKIGVASWRYYTNSVACEPTEYYLGAGEAPGRWSGRGLETLGLSTAAEVSEAQLEAMFARALHPGTGERLGRAWRADGVTGFDLTFSAPKSVSALWALGHSATASQVRGAHRAAVDAALSYLDLHAGLSRRGVDGIEQIGTAGLIAATFEHRTSRCADPQLHTHALVVNKVFCHDGIWRSLDATELFRHKKSAGMIYQAALRSELTGSLGIRFEIADSNGQAEIVGVPDGLLKLWSKRTAQIEPEAAEKAAEYEADLGRELTSAERAAVTKTAVLKTRPSKEHNNVGALQEHWIAEAQQAGYDAETVLADVRGAAAQVRRAEPVTEDQLVAAALEAAASARSTFSRADLAGQVAARLPAGGLTAVEVVARVEALTDRALGAPEAVSVGRHPTGRTSRESDARWAGAAVLAAEGRVLGLADRGRAGGYGKVPVSSLTTATREAGLDAGQLEAVRLLTESGDFLSVLTAPAGAGKTRTLGAATLAWGQAGYRVIGLASSARAAAELAKATGWTADTLAKWLYDHGRRGVLTPDLYARVALDARTVVVVDEASMANTFDLDTLVTAAARKAAKVVLVGDPGQIGVVNGPGGMLAALASRGHGVELGTVHRFSQSWETAASLGLRSGVPEVLAQYDVNERLHSHAVLDDALDAVHAHWQRERAAGREVLMMARTRVDVEALNQRARQSAQASGESYGPVIRIGDSAWQAGDLLRTRRNNRTLTLGDSHVRNGDRWRVISGNKDGLIVEDLTTRGRMRLPARYVSAHTEAGWASTIDSAQGATVDVGIVLVRPGIDREHLYVATTRGREANHAYVVTDTSIDVEHHAPTVAGPLGQRAAGLDEQAMDVLLGGLAKSGAQDSAHAARDNARARAEQEQRRAAEMAARASGEPLPIPAEHEATATRLTERQHRRVELEQTRAAHERAADQARLELASTARWHPHRRAELHQAVADHTHSWSRTVTEIGRLDREIETLTRQVAHDTGRRVDQQRIRAATALAQATSNRQDAVLAPAVPVESSDRGAKTSPTVGTRRQRDLERHAEHLRNPRQGIRDRGYGPRAPGI